MDVYALTISITEIHVEQANNEIRNAMTHLARAIDASRSIPESENEIKKAKGHFERAKRDCYKLCIINLHEQIQEEIALIEFSEGLIQQKYKTRLRELEKKRKDAFKKETKNDSPACVVALEEITLALLDLRDQLRENHTNPYTFTAKARRAWIKYLASRKALITGVPILLLAGESALRYGGQITNLIFSFFG